MLITYDQRPVCWLMINDGLECSVECGPWMLRDLRDPSGVSQGLAFATASAPEVEVEGQEGPLSPPAGAGCLSVWEEQYSQRFLPCPLLPLPLIALGTSSSYSHTYIQPVTLNPSSWNSSCDHLTLGADESPARYSLATRVQSSPTLYIVYTSNHVWVKRQPPVPPPRCVATWVLLCVVFQLIMLADIAISSPGLSIYPVLGKLSFSAVQSYNSVECGFKTIQQSKFLVFNSYCV